MKYIKADWDDEFHGFAVDPARYLAELPRLAPALPPGARAFVMEPGHYRFGSVRCVKDLELAEVRVATDRSGTVVLRFAPNQWKHEEGLVIRYTRVTRFSVDYHHGIDWMAADTLVLDEVLPDPVGCRHEIALTDGTITVHGEDLEATWTASRTAP